MQTQGPAAGSQRADPSGGQRHPRSRVRVVDRRGEDGDDEAALGCLERDDGLRGGDLLGPQEAVARGDGDCDQLLEVCGSAPDRDRRWRPPVCSSCDVGQVLRADHRQWQREDDAVRQCPRMPGPVRTSPPQDPLTLGDFDGGERPEPAVGGVPQVDDPADVVVRGGHFPARRPALEPQGGEETGNHRRIRPGPPILAGRRGRRLRPTSGQRSGRRRYRRGRRPR
jgi:hypothetical protein